MYILGDANIAAGYYLPRSLRSAGARGRARPLVDAIRSGAWPHKLKMPNFCIAETFGVFAKHSSPDCGGKPVAGPLLDR